MKTLPKSFQALIQKLTIIPGVGKKSALRIGLHMMQKKQKESQELAESIVSCISQLTTCVRCQNLCDAPQELCSICQDPKRDSRLLCVVESLSNLMAIEDTHHYQGCYFVLHGNLSPIDRIGPEELGIPKLLNTVNQLSINELILATSATIEGNATSYYIAGLCSELPCRISKLATGIPIGTDFEYLNQHTLYQALHDRQHWSHENS